MKPRKQPLFSMSEPRGCFSSAKKFFFLVALVYAAFTVDTGQRSLLNKVQSPQDLYACKSCREESDTKFADIDAHATTKLLPRDSFEQQNLENICPAKSTFCFYSTLTGFSLEETGVEPEVSKASRLQPEGISHALVQVGSYRSSSPEPDIFRLIGGRVISCSLCQPDDFHEFPSTDANPRNGPEADVSSLASQLADHHEKSNEKVLITQLVILNGLSTPSIKIEPFILDWGEKNLYHPSQAFLTVKNVDANCILHIYGQYSNNLDFYPCNFSGMVLSPGEATSICFIYLPTRLGLSTAQLVLQTSIGGFLIQAKGLVIKSPYLAKPLRSFGVFSIGGWSKNLSLLNPFNEALHVEEITVWISVLAENTSHSSKFICKNHVKEDSSGYSTLGAEELLKFEIAEGNQPKISIEQYQNWGIGPQEEENILELEVSNHFKGKLNGAFCLHLVRSSEKKSVTLLVPLEAELRVNPAPDASHLSVSLEALVPCNTNVSLIAAVSVRNDAPYVLRVANVSKVGRSSQDFHVKSIEVLVLFPRSTTLVAFVTYDHRGTPGDNMSCKLIIQTNDTRSSRIEVPCIDVINRCPDHNLASIYGYAQGHSRVDYSSRGVSFRSSLRTAYLPQVIDTREAVLRNWKSQGASSFMSVLADKELLFPMVEVGNQHSQWIAVQNPSQEPIMLQLILNSGEAIGNCTALEMHLQPSLSRILVGNESVALARRGFSIGKDALTEAFIHLYGTASLGTILFQPPNRCEWRSSAHNLTGLEWFSLRGFGGSLSLMLLEGSDPVQILEFKLHKKIYSPESLQFTRSTKPSCNHILTEVISAKNTGDFPLEVLRIGVSGSKCGLDGFLILNCKGFTLSPGESVMLQILYQSDYTAATVQRDLELTLANGILVIPMKSSIPISLLNFCHRSIFWMRLKKAMVVIVFAAILLFPLVCLLASTVGKYSLTISCAIDYLSMHFNRKIFGSMPQNKEGLVRSTPKAASSYADHHATDKVQKRRLGYLKQKDSVMHDFQETSSSSPVLLNSSQEETSNFLSASDSINLRVITGKEKARRRRKKKSHSSGAIPGFIEVSSSQSSNSTPSSPLSPAACLTPKRVSPDTKKHGVVGTPFTKSSIQHHTTNESLVDIVSVRHLNGKWCSSTQGKSTLSEKVPGRAILLPSASFPITGRATAPWLCRTPSLVSTSTISPHARAPGSKLHDAKIGEVMEDMGLEQKFTYDIWGDHLFKLPSTYPTEKVSKLSHSEIENNSESFFVRDPRTLMTNSVLKPDNATVATSRSSNSPNRIHAFVWRMI